MVMETCLDLLYALDPDNRPDFGAMSKEELKSWVNYSYTVPNGNIRWVNV